MSSAVTFDIGNGDYTEKCAQCKPRNTHGQGCGRSQSEAVVYGCLFFALSGCEPPGLTYGLVIKALCDVQNLSPGPLRAFFSPHVYIKD